MRWIFLSPHLDDAVLSAGGMISEQTQAGEPVEVWTVFAGDPPPPPFTPFAAELHARWGAAHENAAALRRAEDAAACQALAAGVRHGALPDCIYRRLPGSQQPVIRERDDLFRAFPEGESYLVEQIADWIRAGLQTGDNLISPMALGGHVDHRLVRAAAESLSCPLLYYADYPYAVSDPLSNADLRGETAAYRPALVQGLSPQAVTDWQDAIAAYASQISSFWGSLDEMRARIAAYNLEGGGSMLFRGPQN